MEILIGDMNYGMVTVTDIGETMHHDDNPHNLSPSSFWNWNLDFDHWSPSCEMVLVLADQLLYLNKICLLKPTPLYS